MMTKVRVSLSCRGTIDIVRLFCLNCSFVPFTYTRPFATQTCPQSKQKRSPLEATRQFQEEKKKKFGTG
jgi:hypothetical protein